MRKTDELGLRCKIGKRHVYKKKFWGKTAGRIPAVQL